MFHFIFAFVMLFAPLSQESGHASWPLTDDQFEMLYEDTFLWSFDSKARKKVHLETWEQLHDFIYVLLEGDYSHLVKETSASAGHFYRVAYQLLGLHGSIEDAKDLFDAVKGISFSKQCSIDHDLAMIGMFHGLGYFLMRDHLKPQKNRALMQEIEDYLFDCSDWKRPSCWPFEYEVTEEQLGRPFTEREKRPYRMRANEAISYGLSQRGIDRCHQWLKQASFFDMTYQAKLCLSDVEETQSLAQKILPELKPVLSYEEMINTSESSINNRPIQPRRPLLNVLKQKPPLRIDLPFGFGEKNQK